MPRNEDEEQRQRPWLRTLHAARENCRERVADAMIELDDPDRALWAQNGRLGRRKRIALAAHVAVIDYADQLRPFRDKLVADKKSKEGIWTETLDTIALSESNRIPVSLERLDEIAMREVTVREETEDELYGRQTETRRMRVVLPAKTCQSCYRQLNEAVTQLGFAAEPDVDRLPRGRLNVPQPKA